MRFLSFTAAVAAVLLSASLVPVGESTAQEPRTTVPSDPVFQVIATDATTTRGRIAAIDPTGGLTLDTDDGLVEIALDRLVSLQRDPWPIAAGAVAERSVVLFPGGDRLRAIIGTVEQGALKLRPPVLEDAETPVPLDQVLGVVLAPPSQPEARDDLLRQVTNDPRVSDQIWLANGDRMSGVIDRVGSEAIRVELDAGGIDLPRSSVLAFGFDPSIVEYPEPPGTYLELTFVDGSRLGVTDARIEKGRLIARTRFGAEIRPAISTIARVVARSESVAYLSERPESAVEYLGYLGEHPGTYGRGRTWDDHPLRLGDIPYDRGLGTLPLTRLAYVLQPDDQRFQATVGLDARAGERASVVFRVFVDREERFTSPPLTPRDRPLAVDVDLGGGRVLILVTEFGESGDVEDFADWIDARLIR